MCCWIGWVWGGRQVWLGRFCLRFALAVFCFRLDVMCFATACFGLV